MIQFQAIKFNSNDRWYPDDFKVGKNHSLMITVLMVQPILSNFNVNDRWYPDDDDDDDSSSQMFPHKSDPPDVWIDMICTVTALVFVFSRVEGRLSRLDFMSRCTLLLLALRYLSVAAMLFFTSSPLPCR